MSESYQSRSHPFLIASVVTIAVLVVAGWLLRDEQVATAQQEELVVYCAAGIRKPVEELAAIYEKAHDVRMRLDYGSSGEMEGKLELDRESNVLRADLYIPADITFSRRARDKGLTEEEIPLASFRLVLAGKPDVDLGITSLQQVLDRDLGWVLCEAHAGVGKETKTVLDAHGLYDAFYNGKKAAFPRVPEAAAAIASSDAIDVGFIWDTTANQHGLRIYELPELAQSQALITANVVHGSQHPTAALRFARYLAAPETGNPVFAAHYFTPVRGDPWQPRPKLEIYAGGMNRDAVQPTIDHFEAREGCRVDVTYAGCGTLVAGMKARTDTPDLYLTCDTSYMDQVAERFGPDALVSDARIVILVRAGNPKNIQTPADLAKPSIALSTNDPEKSTLGFLSWELLRAFGVAETIQNNGNWAVTTPTAHEAIAQMQASNKLDAALVYDVNCNYLPEDAFELIAIDHPRATAVQNVAVAKDSAFQQLTGRLMQAMLSPASRERYLQLGFGWKGEQ